MPRCFLSSVRPFMVDFIQNFDEKYPETEAKPNNSTTKTSLKKQRNLLKTNETIYHDKVPISTRFYLQLLKRSQFLSQFVENEIYDYASESEKPVNSPEFVKTKSTIKIEGNKATPTYNLRSTQSAVRKYFCVKRTRKPKTQNESVENSKVPVKLPDRKRKNRKEPLAPIIDELKNRETASKGSEIDKIAEKLKSMARNTETCDKTMLFCKESFDLGVIENELPLVTETKQASPPKPLQARARENHACTHCGKTFDRPWVLKGHLRMHTGERPFACPHPHCTRTFADRSNLRAHQRTRSHHSWQWRCPTCGKAFSQRRYLQRHRNDACRKYKLVQMNSRNSKLKTPIPLYGIVSNRTLGSNSNALQFKLEHPPVEGPIDLSMGNKNGPFI